MLRVETEATLPWVPPGGSGDLRVGEPVIAITALPLYHIFSLQSNCLTMMAQGGIQAAIVPLTIARVR